MGQGGTTTSPHGEVAARVRGAAAMGRGTVATGRRRLGGELVPKDRDGICCCLRLGALVGVVAWSALTKFDAREGGEEDGKRPVDRD